VILGLDPSLTSSGFCLATVDRDGHTDWICAGSVRPDPSAQPWARALAAGQYISDLLQKVEISEFLRGGPTGFMLCYEAPTPMADALQIANTCLRASIRSADNRPNFSEHWELCVNAMTMRSVMGLKAKGNNKWENKGLAWSLLPGGKEEWPGLDGDAADGFLFTQLGVWTASLFKNGIEAKDVPISVINRFCDPTQDYDVVRRDASGKKLSKAALREDPTLATSAERVCSGSRGILYDSRYWFRYERSNLEVKVKDAQSSKSRLESFEYEV
jgi:hypothetical protein